MYPVRGTVRWGMLRLEGMDSLRSMNHTDMKERMWCLE